MIISPAKLSTKRFLNKKLWIIFLLTIFNFLLLIAVFHADSTRATKSSTKARQSGTMIMEVRPDDTPANLSQSRVNKEKGFKTSNIPYKEFLSPLELKVFETIGNNANRTVILNLPEKYNNISFLKDRPNLRLDDDAVTHNAQFGDPKNFNCNETYCTINGRSIQKELIIENPDDMFEFSPPEKEFLSEFKNPCWKGKDNLGRENLFCLPYFFIIGFTKCGTTDLTYILRKHPLISPRAGKETHFFDRRRRGRSQSMNTPSIYQPRAFMHYANRGSYRDDLIGTYKEIPGTDVLFHGITSDSTPSYVWDNEFWEKFHPGHKEPPITNADTIFKLNPKTKLIFSLRDPINRMQSAYQFFCKTKDRGFYHCDKPITPEKYHNLVVEAVSRFNICLHNNTVRGCTYSTSTHQLATHLYASIYHVYIADFMRIFPRDQIYFLKFEEHIANPVTSLNDICDFLDVPRFPKNSLLNFLDHHETRNAIRSDKKLPYVLPQTIKILEEFFKPHLLELVRLLGDEKWFWRRPH